MKTISITDITAWLYCARKLYLSLVKGMRQPLNKAMLIGKMRHNIVEIFSKTERSIIIQIDKDYDSIDLVLMYEKFLRDIAARVFIENTKFIEGFMIDRQEVFKKIMADFSGDIRVRVDSIKSGLSKGFFGEELWKNLQPKYLSELKVESENLGLRGRIDRVEFSEEKIMPYELKTRDNKIFHSDEIQLTAYAMLLEDLYKTQIPEGVIETGSSKKVHLIKPEDKAEVLDIAEKIRNIRESVPEMQSNFNKCRSCDFKDACERL